MQYAIVLMSLIALASARPQGPLGGFAQLFGPFFGGGGTGGGGFGGIPFIGLFMNALGVGPGGGGGGALGPALGG